MKIQYLWLIFVLFLGSCSGTKNNSANNSKVVHFGLNDKMCLIEGEQAQPNSKSGLIEYEQNCIPQTISIPLNKTIEAAKYQIYIGIPITSSLDKLKQAINQQYKENILEKRSNSKTQEFLIKSSYLYNYQVVHKTKSKNVFVFNLVSKDAKLVKKFYDEKYLINKLNCEKKKSK